MTSSQGLSPYHHCYLRASSTGGVNYWIGIAFSLLLLTEATFWLVLATATMLCRLPKNFIVGQYSMLTLI